MLSRVSAGQCKGLLEHDRTGAFVIDAWGEHLKQLYLSRYPVVDTVMTFPACLWASAFIHGELKRGATSAKLRKWVDERIEEALGKEVMLFPVNPCFNDRAGFAHGDHRVLLKYVVREDTWYYYNSLPPRTSKGADHYYNQSKKLIKCVEAQMRKVLVGIIPSYPLRGRLPTNIKVIFPTTLVQESGTLECGVIVCQLIELFMLGMVGGSGVYTIYMSGMYRCKMVHWFVLPFDIAW